MGVSTIGDFIYLVALNIYVLNTTHSPVAVAAIWIIPHISALCMKFWSGSLVDRLNKKRLMVGMDILRAGLVFAIPFLSSVWLLYGVLFVLSCLKNIFATASFSYVTYVIPEEQRQRFNSLEGMFVYGAMVVGPALAGVILLTYTPAVAIWLNAGSFLISGLLTIFLPAVQKEESEMSETLASARNTLSTLVQDWKMVVAYLKENRSFLYLYAFVYIPLIFAAALDAQEVVFTRQVLHLSQSEYSSLITITGAGYILGSLSLVLVNRAVSNWNLLRIGVPVAASGYLAYAFSQGFTSAAIAFAVLGFFHAWAITSFTTYMQGAVPTAKMGRVSNTLGLFVSLFTVVAIALGGFISNYASVKVMVVGLASAMFAVAIGAVVYISLRGSEKKVKMRAMNEEVEQVS